MRSTIEIIEPPRLSSGEGRILDYHSAINALGAINCELMLLSEDSAAISSILGRHADTIREICDQVAEYPDPVTFLRSALDLIAPLEADLVIVESVQKTSPFPPARDLDSLRTILHITKVRVGELSKRQRDGALWSWMEIEDLTRRFTEVFRAMAKHSNGRFGIASDRAQQRANDYLFDLKVESRHGATLHIPPQLPDVLRDLAANARKYSSPGDTITLHLKQSDEGISVRISDNGIGIPSGEIEEVCHFGVRGSNVGKVRSLAGGFGLTKAVCLVKQWGGRFWISSEADEGTEIRFDIPTPVMAEMTT
jgi:signal transduction histidine kinase